MAIFGLCHCRIQRVISETKGHATINTGKIIVLHTSTFVILDTKQITKSYETNGSKRSRNFIFYYFIRRYSLNLLDLSQIFELRHILKNLFVYLITSFVEYSVNEVGGYEKCDIMKFYKL